jgi:hypothetical protein
MHRPNPGPFEPIVYFIQTPLCFRILGCGGFALFTRGFMMIAVRHGAWYAVVGLALFGDLTKRWRFNGVIDDESRVDRNRNNGRADGAAAAHGRA